MEELGFQDKEIHDFINELVALRDGTIEGFFGVAKFDIDIKYFKEITKSLETALTSAKKLVDPKER